MRQAIGNILKLAVLCGLAYMVYNWQFDEPGGGDVTDFARRACLDEAGRRYDVSNARVYEVTSNERGYVVRITAKRARGNSVKVVCLTNSHGGVTDLTIEER